MERWIAELVGEVTAAATEPETVMISEDDTKALCAVHAKTGGKPWEPQDYRHPFILRMIDAGMLARHDGRWGFERIKDSFVGFTGPGYMIVALDKAAKAMNEARSNHSAAY